MDVKVNPKILVWAREERGMTAKYVADKLKLEISVLTLLETKGEPISFSILESIARLYKRQTAAFFLPDVPQKIRKPKDYRNLAIDEPKFSPETMLAIRRTERYLEVSRELSGSQYWNKQYEWLKGLPTNQKEIISVLKELLEVESDRNSKKQGSDEAFRNWRAKIEDKLGIFVFQFPMSEDKLDGFSYAFEQFPYAIVVNNQNSSVRKIFTLFHELSHILKHTPGACNTDFSTQTNGLEIELECNNFAGNFLVPTEFIKYTESLNDIFKFAKSLNISGEVYLRRLFDEKMMEKNKFFELLKLVKERSNNFPKKKLKGAPSRIIQSKSTRGNKFFNLVTNAATTRKISFSSASDLLGLKVGSIQS